MTVARRDVVGLMAYCQTTGAGVGRVAEVLCARGAERVIGFVLEGRGRRRRVVPFEEVAAVGPSAVLLRDAIVLAAGEGPRLREVRRRTEAVIGRRVLTADGRELGIVDDLVFDGNGRVLGFRVSGGLLADLLSGQGFLPADAGLAWRPQAVVVAASAEAVADRAATEAAAVNEASWDAVRGVSTAGIGDRTAGAVPEAPCDATRTGAAAGPTAQRPPAAAGRGGTPGPGNGGL